jgi:hypothetical protein
MERLGARWTPWVMFFDLRLLATLKLLARRGEAAF